MSVMRFYTTAINMILVLKTHTTQVKHYKRFVNIMRIGNEVAKYGKRGVN